ncbi:hypothetical protein [Streptomyces griseus]|uniref:hypothetical protein n=1 Tax=Streptomyces griseus TaxID=1911 RepID=UPI0037FC9BC4
MFDDPGDAVLHLFGELEERLQDTVIDPVGMGRAVLGEQAGGGFVLAPGVGRFHVGGEFEHQVVAVGDEAEATYLEVKIRLDMNSKATAAKIAKFLLGAANRRPGEAARHFHGYAVLVIGAQKHSAPGVLRGTEAHELEGSRESGVERLAGPARIRAAGASKSVERARGAGGWSHSRNRVQTR